MKFRNALLGAVLAVTLSPWSSGSLFAQDYDVLNLPSEPSELADKSLIMAINQFHGRWFAVGHRGHILHSDDGVNWTPVPTGPIVLPLGTDVYVGLAVTSHRDGVLTTAQFDGVTIR